jgi:UPF0042 nucleotide-binding protein
MALSLVILTGQSGSGKSTAIHALEDQGVFCVDNIPTALVDRLVEAVADEGAGQRVALVMDVRGPRFAERAPALVRQLRAGKHPLRVVYLEATEAALVRRYSETRRKHPLDNGSGLRDAIARERELLAPLRELADDTINTAEMSPHELRARVVEQIVNVRPGDALRMALLSFGFKHGLPLDVDMVLDVRFLPNPYFDTDLRHLSGLDEPVSRFVVDSDDGREFVERAEAFLSYLVPQYQEEGRQYLTVGIGCTGGQHRSVAIAEALAAALARRGIRVDRRHRDVKEAPS